MKSLLYFTQILMLGLAVNGYANDTSIGRPEWEETAWLAREMASLLGVKGDFVRVSDVEAKFIEITPVGDDYGTVLREITRRLSLKQPQRGVLYEWRFSNKEILLRVLNRNGALEDILTFVWAFDDTGRLLPLRWTQSAGRSERPEY